ncbi:SDR family NAD(P)-dependent oxidoreductase [Novosphingobium bradum]|uniref:SDR family NAD(P)-dependent oxidoreductase n=1 Tax=Novosphingobium bradum TaxID=1737444 RepID=A0ABV7IR44_9SPHN
MNSLEGKVALVTGAARGLGEHVARAIARAGGKVLVTDIAPEAEAVARDIGEAALFHRLDVTSAPAWGEAVAAAEAAFGPVTVLVNNAVRMQWSSFDELDEAEFRGVFEVNELGCFLGMKAVAGPMRRAGVGSIVNVSSIAGMHPASGIAYCASKWAIRGMTKSVARELAPENIRVNSVHPGWMDVPSGAGANLDEVARLLPLRRVGDPAEIAKLVVFLASDDASMITGGEYLCDSGAMLLGTLEFQQIARANHLAAQAAASQE